MHYNKITKLNTGHRKLKTKTKPNLLFIFQVIWSALADDIVTWKAFYLVQVSTSYCCNWTNLSMVFGIQMPYQIQEGSGKWGQTMLRLFVSCPLCVWGLWINYEWKVSGKRSTKCCSSHQCQHKLYLIYKRILLEGIFREVILTRYHSKEDLCVLRFRSLYIGETWLHTTSNFILLFGQFSGEKKTHTTKKDPN